jgi:hypothetical protein
MAHALVWGRRAGNLETLCASALDRDSMVTSNESDESSPAAKLRKVIDRHGHAFQEAVLRRGEKLHRDRKSSWVFDAAEVPVEVRGDHTRIDFVLYEVTTDVWGPSKYLVAECKRANPALSEWCFAKSQYVRRDARLGDVIVDEVSADAYRLRVGKQVLTRGQDVYHRGFEVRSDSKGEGNPDRSAIETACGQVIRGVNGLIGLLRSRIKILIVNHPTPIIPVVFTTARLWTTDTDLANADLVSGQLNQATLELRPVPWLWYRYHVSPGLTDPEPRTTDADEIGKLVEQWYARCVAIVSSGIDDFFAQRWE